MLTAWLALSQHDPTPTFTQMLANQAIVLVARVRK